MAVEVFIAKMTDFMEAAVIEQWLVVEGERVDEGQPLLEMQTDKATVSLDAPVSGWVKGISLRASAGSTVAVGETVAYIVSSPDEEVAVP